MDPGVGLDLHAFRHEGRNSDGHERDVGFEGFGGLAADGEELQGFLVPADPLDAHDVFLEIRAAAGGDEAAIFAGDLLRMYTRYADGLGWKVELLSESRGEHGGYREVVTRVSGKDVYARLKFESGTHRVQRVPATEAQGRIHTSTCTAAVLPEQDEVADVVLSDADLRVDTFRASGAGGQHVNKTDSAIRITHLPTGIVVECQDERSQHKNDDNAMKLLKSRLFKIEEQKRKAEVEKAYDEKGEPVVWVVQMESAAVAFKHGITRETFPQGTVMSMGVHPRRDGKPAGDRGDPPVSAQSRSGISWTGSRLRKDWAVSWIEPSASNGSPMRCWRVLRSMAPMPSWRSGSRRSGW